jgi:hypothetical protein
MQILTEAELIKEWRLETETELKVFKRMLNQNLPKKVCPQYINPKHFFKVGGSYRFRFDQEKGWPTIIQK